MSTDTVACVVDGAVREWAVEPRTTLADALTDDGCPINTGCAAGQCGTCLVELDGAPVRSCLVLAGQCDGATVRTARADDPCRTAIRERLSANHGIQCGYCGPGMLTMLTDLANRPEPADLRRALSEVTCRCTGYQGLVNAAKRVVGVDAGRTEDARLLTGRGDFVGARRMPGQCWARVVRSPLPHARIAAIDPTAALAVPGVLAVFTAADLPDSLRLRAEELPGPAEPILAAGEVRYVGQPVALVLAESAAAAEDGADAVTPEFTALPPLDDGWPADDDPRWLPPLCQRVGEDLPPETPAVTLTREFVLARQTGMPMETRGLLAGWDADRQVLTVHGVTKHPAVNRDVVAKGLGLSPAQVVMPTGDVGGAFGVKGEIYPEDLLVPWAALRIGRPVRWVEDRAEHLAAINHSRGQTWRVTMSADRTGRLLAADVLVVSDVGAYARPLTSLVPLLATAMFPGPYRLPRYRAEARCLLTTRTPTGTVRAPGRFEANFVRERMLDMLADELGIDPAALRRRNLLTQQDMPYDVGTVNEGPVHYDTGDFLAAFDAAAERAVPAAPVDDGLRRGTVVVPFVEKAGLGGTEVAVATRCPNGTVRLDVASAPSGQSHETSLARIAATALGLPRDRISVVFNDPASGAIGLGTFASRTITHTGNAVHAACLRLRAKLRTAPAGTTVTATGRYDTDRHTYPYGTLTCSVAVDPELFTVRVEHLAISCDAGTVIEPAVVTGQLAGGLAMGIGGALLEELAYDPAGQPLATGLDGYLLPLAADLPDIDVTMLTPAPLTAQSAQNPIGVKGIGEAGVCVAAAAVAGAVCAAMPELNQRVTELPLTPSRLLAAARAAGTGPRRIP